MNQWWWAWLIYWGWLSFLLAELLRVKRCAHTSALSYFFSRTRYGLIIRRFFFHCLIRIDLSFLITKLLNRRFFYEFITGLHWSMIDQCLCISFTLLQISAAISRWRYAILGSSSVLSLPKPYPLPNKILTLFEIWTVHHIRSSLWRVLSRGPWLHYLIFLMAFSY